MFEEAIGSLLSILSLSVGGVSIISILASVFVLSKKIKSVSLTKEYVEEAFLKAVLPANVRLDVSTKILPLVKTALADIEVNLRSYIQQNLEEVEKTKEEIKLVLTILSKFSHMSQLTEEEQQRINDIINFTDEARGVTLG